MRDSTDCFRLPLETVTLSNGLKVLLHPDHSLPVVAVYLCYHVGSKDESPQLTGLAHLFEHLMFEGSRQHDADFFRPLQEAGAMVNGSTGHDTTQYYEVVPSNFLERALWLEADRMEGLLPVLTDAKLENQRSVVKNERLQRIDNQPYGRVGEELFSLLYPEPHPYHWPIIGWMNHLDMIEMNDVRNFFLEHYTPKRAVLTLAGSFDSDDALAMIDRHFGKIPGGEPAARFRPAPTRVLGEYRRTLDEPVALGRIEIAWPTVERFHPDEAALDVLSLVLGDGKDSRLRRRIERDEKLAHSVDAYHSSLALAGYFGVWSYALPGVDAGRLEAIVYDEIKRFCDDGLPEEELQRAKRYFANRAYSKVETVLSKAEMLQRTNFYRGEVRGEMLLEELEQYERVHCDDLVRVAREYLVDRRVVIHVRPHSGKVTVGGEKDSGQMSASPVEKHRDEVDATLLPPPRPTPAFSMPDIEDWAIGPVRLLLVPSRKLPRVTFQLVMDAGSRREQSGGLGLARLTADCLEEGTLSRDPLQLVRELEILGSTLSIDSGIETATLSMRSLRSTLADSFSLFADVLTRPRFAENDVLRERDRLLAELAHREKQPRALADDLIDEVLFGLDHPYGRPSDGTVADVSSFSHQDLHGYHDRFYRPSDAYLVVVGDVNRKEVEDLFGNALTEWMSRSAAETWSASAPPVSSRQRFRHLAREEATQSVLRIGSIAARRDTPDYYALVLLNTILGGSFSSRLNAKLREEKGLTYGVQSSFVLRKETGSFLVGTDVDGRTTHEALKTMIEVISGPPGRHPVTAEELAAAKAYITRRFPARFETQSGILSQVVHTAVYGLPVDYYRDYLAKINAVDLDEIGRVAKTYLRLDKMKIVVVGRADAAEGLADDVEKWIEADGR